MRLSFRLLLAAALAGGAAAPASAQDLRADLVADGLSFPLLALSPDGDVRRLFICEQDPARIQLMLDGELRSTPFLDLSNVALSGGFRGLLSMAFHPDYFSNRYFYVYYTDLQEDVAIVRYERKANNPNEADPNSAFTILELPNLVPGGHYGGHLEFGPDGYLYVGIGDGDAQGDPNGFAQDLTRLQGKMLRIDVDSASPYAIPPDNPYVGNPAARDEIWSSGLRQPWRFDFDPLTDDLYIADVGQDAIEEIDFEAAGSAGGVNYGWNLKEGTACFSPPSNCDPGGITTDPIYEYAHLTTPFKCSITGGYVYRGSALPDWQGHYFFADYCSREFWSFKDGPLLTDFTDHTAALTPHGGLSLTGITSFGIDAHGEMYYCDGFTGSVYKIVPAIVKLEITNLVAGQNGTWTVSGCTPNGTVFLAWSLIGNGPTESNFGLVMLDSPFKTAPPLIADGSGTATHVAPVKAGTSGTPIWFQALDLGQGLLSNALAEVIG